jgi:hypothetical protein
VAVIFAPPCSQTTSTQSSRTASRAGRASRPAQRWPTACRVSLCGAVRCGAVRCVKARHCLLGHRPDLLQVINFTSKVADQSFDISRFTITVWPKSLCGIVHKNLRRDVPHMRHLWAGHSSVTLFSKSRSGAGRKPARCGAVHNTTVERVAIFATNTVPHAIAYVSTHTSGPE